MRSLLNVRPHFGRPAPEVGPVVLTQDFIEQCMAAADTRRPTEAPTIYDLVALCDELMTSRPFQARSAKKTLRWLMKQAERINQQERWDHPWQRSR